VTAERHDETTDPDAVRDTAQTSTNQAKAEPTPPGPAASPGFVNDEPGHVAVSIAAAQGTSEQLPVAEGIKTTAIAQPGKPDGEVAT
jgi:hypothetical protein